ncbi:AKH_1a_G0017360.mRNA.1.CDS.1 [Saccharomyces cerevisiae]|nr:AKH_1a_G0017360.mRNA.1.CDS.1 [Saccharomyces cerevisiae]CAI6648000.1 AKH_1a_G0017360.mRNA.1.CDS.1 [Saccharomyces cerevisiae]
MIFGPTSVYSKCSAKSSGIIKDTAKLPISRVRIKVMLEITDFSNDFVSEELIYALVALGAKNSFDNSLSKHTYEYCDHSKRNLLEDSTNKNSAFSSASVTKPQCLLYLAFFDITVGELTSGWLLSGIAFGMCFTLGFERDPSEWMHSSELSNNIREGCVKIRYAYVHDISFILIYIICSHFLNAE